MSVSQPPSDAPFGLQPNVAAGLAYVFTWLGGIIFFVGGGTNRFVKFAAAQSITLWVAYFLVWWLIGFLVALTHGLLFILWMIYPFVGLALWLWTVITAFQGKELRIPYIADITDSIFKTTKAA